MGAVALFFCFVGMSYFKNQKTFTSLGVFYGAYALVMNSFLGYLAADPITNLQEVLLLSKLKETGSSIHEELSLFGEKLLNH